MVQMTKLSYWPLHTLRSLGSCCTVFYLLNCHPEVQPLISVHITSIRYLQTFTVISKWDFAILEVPFMQFGYMSYSPLYYCSLALNDNGLFKICKICCILSVSTKWETRLVLCKYMKWWFLIIQDAYFLTLQFFTENF